MFDKIKEKIDFNKVFYIVGILYLLFLFRRGGDSKYKMAVLMMVLSAVYGYKNKFENIKRYIWVYIFGVLYLLSLGIVFYVTANKGNGRVEDFLGMTLYSVVFFLATINIKLDEKIYSKIIPIITLFSLESIYRGFKTLYIQRWQMTRMGFRLRGGTYTTIYAAELGVGIVIGIIWICIYKSKKIKIFYAFYTSLFLILLYFTKSRNSMLMIPITLCILLILKYKKKSLLGLCIILFSFSLLVKVAPKISGLKRLTTLSSLEKIKSDPRHEIFEKGIIKGKENLFLGEGFNFYKDSGMSTSKAGLQPHYHNIFIETFATQGAITLIFYVLFLSFIFFYMIKNYIIEENEKIKNIKFLTVGVSSFILLYGLAEPVFYFTKIYMILFTFVSINFISVSRD